MHRLLTKTSGSALVAVIGGDCPNNSRLISKDLFSSPPKDGAVRSRGVAEPFLLLIGKPAYGPRLVKGEKKQWVLCEEETQSPQTV